MGIENERSSGYLKLNIISDLFNQVNKLSKHCGVNAYLNVFKQMSLLDVAVGQFYGSRAYED